MTLIASTLNYKMPFLISDLVWSEYSNSPVEFPTSTIDPTPYLPNDQDEKPVKLGQKMYIINEKVCIVFAGLGNQISVFLSVFKETFKSNKTISKEDIHNFLNAYKLRENYFESAFFITQIENLNNGAIKVNQFYSPFETNKVDPFKLNIVEDSWNIMANPNFETVSACGTGAEGFLNIIRQTGIIDSKYEEGDFMRAVQTNTTLVSILLTLERVAVYTLKENWGGGFEIAYYNGNSFEKIDNIAYIISHSRFDASGDIGLPIPMLIMFYKYRNEILYITSIEVYKYTIQETDLLITFTSNNGEFRTTLYEVEGIDIVDINDYKLPKDFSFSTNKVSMGYSLITPDEKIFNPAFFNMGDELNINFRQGEKVEVKIHKKIIDDIRVKSREVFQIL